MILGCMPILAVPDARLSGLQAVAFTANRTNGNLFIASAILRTSPIWRWRDTISRKRYRRQYLVPYLNNLHIVPRLNQPGSAHYYTNNRAVRCDNTYIVVLCVTHMRSIRPRMRDNYLRHPDMAPTSYCSAVSMGCWRANCSHFFTTRHIVCRSISPGPSYACILLLSPAA